MIFSLLQRSVHHYGLCLILLLLGRAVCQLINLQNHSSWHGRRERNPGLSGTSIEALTASAATLQGTSPLTLPPLIKAVLEALVASQSANSIETRREVPLHVASITKYSTEMKTIFYLAIERALDERFKMGKPRLTEEQQQEKTAVVDECRLCYNSLQPCDNMLRLLGSCCWNWVCTDCTRRHCATIRDVKCPFCTLPWKKKLFPYENNLEKSINMGPPWEWKDLAAREI